MIFGRSKRFGKILNEYLNDTLSAEQLDDAVKIILDDENRQLLEKIAEKRLRDKGHVFKADRETIDRRFSMLMETARNTPKDPAEKADTVTRIIPMWSRFAAAASILLVIALGGTWIVDKLVSKRSAGTIGAMVIPDLGPGGERAVLTLSDGSTVLLDTAAQGILATQARTNVFKLADGRIVYRQTGKETAKVLYNTITTPRGGEYSIILPDSTRIWLNAESSVRFPVQFTGDERKIEITGEVFLEVAKDHSMPFRVVTGTTTIEVLGTSFNVRAYPDESSTGTTLIEGSVKVMTASEVRHIAPGQRAETGSNGIITVDDNVDIEEITAWKNGVFLFNSKSIHEIMNEIGRWYDVSIEYGEGPFDKTFSGIVSRKSNVSQVLSLMEPYGIKFTITEEMIRVESVE